MLPGRSAHVLWPLLLLICTGSVFADPAYQPGTLLAVEKKVELTPASWLWDTVVTYHETVRYELRIQLKDDTCLAEYQPLVQPTGILPTEWRPGGVLQVRLAKHLLFVKLSYGEEIETRLLRCARRLP